MEAFLRGALGRVQGGAQGSGLTGKVLVREIGPCAPRQPYC
jgi:hypothetical protein